jgi:uncharacterized protein YjbJ (UPF0337 family)
MAILHRLNPSLGQREQPSRFWHITGSLRHATDLQPVRFDRATSRAASKRSQIWTRIESKVPDTKPRAAVGKMTGDKKTQSEGTAEKAAGKVQNAVGGVKDTVKETFNR